MTEFVESLKRLFKAEKITIEKLEKFLNDGKITQDEFDYITE